MLMQQRADQYDQQRRMQERQRDTAREFGGFDLDSDHRAGIDAGGSIR